MDAPLGRRGRGPAFRHWVIAMAVACGPGNDGRPAGDAAEAEAESAAAEPAVQDSVGRDVDPDRLIRRDGIAQAAAGMRIADLRAALPEGVSLGLARPYMVDIAAMPVIEGSDTLYMVLIPSGEPSSDDARIHLVATTDTTFRTMEGVGPGSTLADAAEVYGPATLAYSTNDESREYATFPTLPTTIRFRVRPTSDTAAFAGIYTSAGEYNETTRYHPGSISMVLVFTR